MPISIRKTSSIAALSMTPLIDVVFLLLIFFLVAARYEEEERDLRVKLPQASEAQPTIFPGREIVVTITPAGQFVVDGSTKSAAELEGVLRQAEADNPGKRRVRIRADENAKSGALVAALNACNRAKIREYLIATE